MGEINDKPNKYLNGMIYKIVCGDKCYIGSTINTLALRKAIHKYHYKTKFGSGTSAYFLFDSYGIDNCKWEIIEKFPCETRKELEIREGHYIKLFKNDCVNLNISGRTSKQYHIDNKDVITIKNKTYYESNKLIISKQKKQYYLKKKLKNTNDIIE
jgi:hypothetical protein